MARLLRHAEMLVHEKKQHLGHLAENSLEVSHWKAVVEEHPLFRTRLQTRSAHHSGGSRQPGRPRGAATSSETVLRRVHLILEMRVAEFEVRLELELA